MLQDFSGLSEAGVASGPSLRPLGSGNELLFALGSESLRELMERKNISLSFSDANGYGLCIADATNNPTGAYKVRGALAAVSAARAAGCSLVVAASAGNHGAGVAYAAQQMGLKAVVYVPEDAPQVKVNSIRSFGARVIQRGARFDECLSYALTDPDVERGSGKFVHAFDDPAVIAGQGTIGVELLEHIEQNLALTDCYCVRVFLPIGGGGLAAGVASAMKVLWRHPEVQLQIVGVVDESAPASLLGIIAGRPVQVVPDTIADGTKVARVGGRFLGVSHLVDYLLTVPHDEIVSSMRDYEHRVGVKIEGAGALALAGESFARRHHLFGDRLQPLSYAVVTGKNVDVGTFERAVTERVRLNSKLFKRQAFTVCIPEQEGELLRFLRAVQNYNIVGLMYKQRPDALLGHLRVEFEVQHVKAQELERCIGAEFPGSKQLSEWEQMLHSVGGAVVRRLSDELITLEDRPGSFLERVEALTQTGSFGSVGLLFYRQPARPGSQAQVLIGRSMS